MMTLIPHCKNSRMLQYKNVDYGPKHKRTQGTYLILGVREPSMLASGRRTESQT